MSPICGQPAPYQYSARGRVLPCAAISNQLIRALTSAILRSITAISTLSTLRCHPASRPGYDRPQGPPARSSLPTIAGVTSVPQRRRTRRSYDRRRRYREHICGRNPHVHVVRGDLEQVRDRSRRTRSAGRSKVILTEPVREHDAARRFRDRDGHAGFNVPTGDTPPTHDRAVSGLTSPKRKIGLSQRVVPSAETHRN